MNDEIKEILDRLEYDKDDVYYVGYTDGVNIDNTLMPKDIKLLLDYITNLQQKEELLRQEVNDVRKAFKSLQQENERLKEENERLKQNQVKALNRIRDFINSSKCEITEGSYCDDKHSQYWEMFKQFAEELQNKIKGLDTKDYVYIPKWREQELLSQEEQLEDYKSRIEKAVEYIEKHSNSFSVLDTISNGTLLNILNGRSDE